MTRGAKWSGPCSVADCVRPARVRGWCHLHYERWLKRGVPTVDYLPKISTQARFLQKVDKAGECWVWTSTKDRMGYGKFWVRGLQKSLLAHRVAFMWYVGPIPKGFDIDHLCRNPSCVRPDHLEPVTRAENLRRGLRGVLTTHCPYGHDYSLPGNVYLNKRGHRHCAVCTRERQRRYHARKRAEKASA